MFTFISGNIVTGPTVGKPPSAFRFSVVHLAAESASEPLSAEAPTAPELRVQPDRKGESSRENIRFAQLHLGVAGSNAS